MFEARSHATCVRRALVSILGIATILESACGRAGYDTKDAAHDARLDAHDESPTDAQSIDAISDAGPLDAGPLDASRPDASEDDAASIDAPMGTDAGVIVLDPGERRCELADEGPFVEAGRFVTAGDAYGVWYSAPFVLVGETTGGFSSFRFDGTTFTLAGNRPTGWTEAIWNHGEDVFVASPGTGVRVFRLDGAGVPALVSEDLVLGVEARRGWSDGTHVFVPTGPGGLRAYTHSGGRLTPVGTPLPTTQWSQGAWTNGTLIFLADGSSIRLLQFDGATFTALASSPLTGATRVWGARQPDIVLVAHGGGVSAFRFTSVSITEIASRPLPSPAREVWSDGANVFVAAEASGVYALAFDGVSFRLLDQIDTTGEALGVVGDGQYIYVGDQAAGLVAYRGFRCLRLTP